MRLPHGGADVARRLGGLRLAARAPDHPLHAVVEGPRRLGGGALGNVEWR